MIKYVLSILLFFIGLLWLILAIKKEPSNQFSLKHYLWGRRGDMAPLKETAIANGVMYIALGIICAVLFYFFDKLK
jgi:Zn-dependent protease